jgi:hypothetical protein
MQLNLSSTATAIRVGQQTMYLLEVHNDRNVPDRNVTVTLSLTDGLTLDRFVSLSTELTLSPRGNQVFEVQQIREMRPGDKRTFRVEVTGRQVGQQSLNVQVASQRSPTPVQASRSVRVEP